MNEIVPMWAIRQKWFENKSPLIVGDIVLTLDRKNDRGKWPIARVIELCPTTDKNIRVVRLYSEGREVTRPIVKLCLIYREDEEVIPKL